MQYFDASTATELGYVVPVLAELDQRASLCGVEIMVVGAVARSILIRLVVDSPPQRATSDVDIAIAVSSWAEFARLTSVFGYPHPSAHRYVICGTQVDIIPFGKIESTRRTIMWPDDYEMDVFGFREAFTSAVRVKFSDHLIVPVASLPAQSLLKLLAWRDRRYEDRRDAIDLKTIILAYNEGPYYDELFSNHVDLLVKHEFDTVLAGAERMGSEANTLIASGDRRVITELLDSDETITAVADDMGGAIANNHRILLAYREGFRRTM